MQPEPPRSSVATDRDSTVPTRLDDLSKLAGAAVPAPGLAAIAASAQAEEQAIKQNNTPDNKALQEEATIEADRRQEYARLAIERETLQNKGLAADISAREVYAKRIYSLIVGWLGACFLVLLLQGFLSKREIALNFRWLGSAWKTAVHFELSEPVQLALIGGTTTTVIGLFVIVANYFFPKR